MASGPEEQRNGDEFSYPSHVESDTQEAQKKDESGETVDWLGRPATGRQLGGWRSTVAIFGAAGCGYFAFNGIYSNLVLYLKRIFHENNAGAANDLTNVFGTMFFTALIGAFLGDAYWGRLWTVVVFLVIFIVGCILVSVAATIQEGAYSNSYPPSWLQTFLYISLYITAVGNGSHQPALASLGGDQFDTPAEKGAFFNWYFVFCNIGQFLALCILTHIENNGNWALGFWISTGAIAIAIPLFLFGAPKCRQHRSGGNPFLRTVQVLVCAVRNFKLKVPPETVSLYEVQGQQSVIPGTRKIRHSRKYRWLDKAAMASGEYSVDAKRTADPWRLCTVTQVEEVKCLLNILPVLITGVIFNTIVAQVTTIFIEQGDTMDPHLGRHFKMPPGTMQVFTVLGTIIFAPIYDRCMVPSFRKRTGHPKGLPSLQRMGWGFSVSILAMVVAAVVEMKRLRAAKIRQLPDSRLTQMRVSIFWLMPQYLIVGISLVLVTAGQMDFFYTEISDGMKSIGMSLTLVCRGLGNYTSTLLVTILTSITQREGKLGWIPKNLNEGHVDYFYWFLAALMLVTLFFHLICAHFHSYLEYENSQDHKRKEVELESRQPDLQA